MIYSLGNNKNCLIRLQKELINITNNLNSVKNRNNKTMNILLNGLKYMENEKSDKNFLNFSNKKSINQNKKMNNINMYINNSRINKRNLQSHLKSNHVSMINLKKSVKKINNNQFFNRNNRISNKKSYENKKASKDISTNYTMDNSSKEKNYFINDFEKYRNVSLNNKNSFNKTYKSNFPSENFNINIEKINKRKINNTNRNSPIKYIKYRNDEISKNNDNIFTTKKSKIILRNKSTRKNNYSKTYNCFNINQKKEYELVDILNLLEAKNINDCIPKIKKLLVYKNLIHHIKNIYLEKNNQNKQKEIKIKDILFWSCSNKNKYEEFCKEIMHENNINDFDNFKSYLTELIKFKKFDNNLLKGINRIFDGFNNKLESNRKIYRNYSQNNIRSDLINKNDDDI